MCVCGVLKREGELEWLGHESLGTAVFQQPRRDILERLNSGEPVVGDGGMTYALEKRGYVKAGLWIPKCTVDHPEAGLLFKVESF